MTVEELAHPGTCDRDVGVGGVLVEEHHLLLDRAVRQDDDREHDARLQQREVGTADHDGLHLRPDDDGRVRGDARQQLARLVQQVVHRHCGGREELGDPAPFGGRERGDAGEVVDVVAVAAVGGDAPRGRVRLCDVALALEHRHLVAHRRRGDPEIGTARDGGRPDRQRARDVLLDDRPQDRGLAIVEACLHCRRSAVFPRFVRVRVLRRPGVLVLGVPGTHGSPALPGPSELELALNAIECQPSEAPPRAIAR